MLGEDELKDVMDAGAMQTICRQMEGISLRHPEVRQKWLAALAAAREAMDLQWRLNDTLLKPDAAS